MKPCCHFISLNDHHKQEFSFLTPAWYNFHHTSAFNYEFHTLSYPTLFLTPRGRSKDYLSIPVGTQENLQPIPFVPLINIRLHLHSFDSYPEIKNKILDSPCVPHPWIKPGTSHHPSSPLSRLSHLVTSLPFHLSHLTNLPPTFYFPEAMQHNFVLELHTHFLE